MIVFAEFNCVIDNVPHRNFQKMKKLCTLCLNLKYIFFRTVISFSEELQIMFIFCDDVDSDSDTDSLFNTNMYILAT